MVAGIICGMIMISNFSTAALLFLTVISMMFVGRIPFRHLALVVAAGIAMLVSIYFLADHLENLPARFQTFRGRIERFIHGDPAAETGITQADYAKLAIYEGGIFGKLPGNSDVANYMAAAYNDFIYAIIIEEYGLIGGILLMGLLYDSLFQGDYDCETHQPHLPGLSGHRVDAPACVPGHGEHGGVIGRISGNRPALTLGEHGWHFPALHLGGFRLHPQRQLPEPERFGRESGNSGTSGDS